MNKFVDGIKYYNGIVFSTDINYLTDNKVVLMCHNYTLRPPMCKTCQKILSSEQVNKLKECDFIILDNKCCLSYDFKS